jgi:hypothetical protein
MLSSIAFPLGSREEGEMDFEIGERETETVGVGWNGPLGCASGSLATGFDLLRTHGSSDDDDG